MGQTRKEGAVYGFNSTIRIDPEKAKAQQERSRLRSLEKQKAKAEKARNDGIYSSIKPKPLSASPRQSMSKTGNPKRKIGTAGHGRTKADIEFHGLVAELGCFACAHLKLQQKSRTCVHHPKGRNKGKSGDFHERYVIALCHEHHDPTTLEYPTDKALPSVHGNKVEFKRLIGTEVWCVHQTYIELGIQPPWVTACEWSEYQDILNQESQEEWLVYHPPALRIFT